MVNRVSCPQPILYIEMNICHVGRIGERVRRSDDRVNADLGDEKMKRKAFLIVVIGLIATFGVFGGSIGIVDTAEASPNGHKSRDSLSGRSFQVNVKDLDLGTSNSNCYTFEEDGTWIDPLFLEDFVFPGTWIQHTGWFVTRYTAFARVPASVDLFVDDGTSALLLIQNGTVTPTWRKGKLRLRAYSTVIIETTDGDGEIVIGNFLSTGHSVDSCD